MNAPRTAAKPDAEDFLELAAHQLHADKAGHFFVAPAKRLGYFLDRLRCRLCRTAPPIRAEILFSLTPSVASRLWGFGPSTVELNLDDATKPPVCTLSVDLWNLRPQKRYEVQLLQSGGVSEQRGGRVLIHDAFSPVHRVHDLVTIALASGSALRLTISEIAEPEGGHVSVYDGCRPFGDGTVRFAQAAEFRHVDFVAAGNVAALREGRHRWRPLRRAAQMAVGAILLLAALPVIAFLATIIAAVTRCSPFYLRRWWTAQGRVGSLPAVKLCTMRKTPGETPAAELRDALLPLGGRLLRTSGFDELPQFLLAALGYWDVIGTWRSFDIPAMYRRRLGKAVVDAYLQAPFRGKPAIVSSADAHKTRSLRGANLATRYLYDRYAAGHDSVAFLCRVACLAAMAMISAEGDEDYPRQANVPRASSTASRGPPTLDTSARSPDNER